mgnify:CR=1 FL=1|jgi:hypothetical protein|tara:strand:- start:554 stop:901 length:348 start_codon:yes stop_codon:yes gene_type:complete
MALPIIQSAIPKRRYQYGEFSITLLTTINSSDPVSYLYIVAILAEGAAKPEVYITCESTTSNDGNTYRIRVLSEQEEHTISQDKQWRNEQKFCDYALQGIQQMFELSDEIPVLIS